MSKHHVDKNSKDLLKNIIQGLNVHSLKALINSSVPEMNKDYRWRQVAIEVMQLKSKSKSDT